MRLWKGILLGVVSANLGCSMRPNEQTELRIRISGPTDDFQIWEPLVLDRPFPPATALGFSCYGVNVIGPGIASSDSHPAPVEPFFSDYSQRKHYCTYPGILSPIITHGQMNTAGYSDSFSLTVPTGPLRIVQLVGLLRTTNGNIDYTCPSTFQDMMDENDAAVKTYAYTLADSVQDLYGSVSPINLGAGGYTNLSPDRRMFRRDSCDDNDPFALVGTFPGRPPNYIGTCAAGSIVMKIKNKRSSPVRLVSMYVSDATPTCYPTPSVTPANIGGSGEVNFNSWSVNTCGTSASMEADLTYEDPVGSTQKTMQFHVYCGP